jgi:hypothetical protein
MAIHVNNLIGSRWQQSCNGSVGSLFEPAMRKATIMLRVETQEVGTTLIFRLEGRFTSDGAEQVRLLVARCDSKLELIVDLTEVTFIDAMGENVLSLLKKLGAEFVAETAYSRDICDRLSLPLLGSPTQSSQASGNEKLRSRPNALALG